MALDISRLKDCSRYKLNLPITRLASGNALEIPVNVIAGRGSTPVFVCIAGIHGDEPEGILALLDLWHDVEPSELMGRLVLVPVANPTAFAAGRRVSPLDGIDLNRSFPGRDDGGPSQRLAWELFNSIVMPANLVFSLHSWYSSGVAESFIESPAPDGRATQIAFEAARMSGFERVRITNWPEGLLGRVAISNGIPAIEGEVGGMGCSLPENRMRYGEHLRRLMAFLKMSPEHKVVAVPPEICTAQHVIAREGGILRLNATLGANVSEGDELATILDLHGDRTSSVDAPIAGRIGAHRTQVSVQPGDNLFTIFQPTNQPTNV
jgi:N2-acetyl-L-2,4-diaminobutanoate deacetylase